MANTYFQFKQFIVHQQGAAMKVTTDACLFGAWVAQQLQKENETFLHTLDIGTGTGLLSLMLAQKAATSIDAVEIDAATAEQAHQNFALSPWKDQLQLREGDIQKINLYKSYDGIISNPPFYENELASPQSARNIAHHSSHLTLQALLQLIYQNLNEEGVFFLLLPFKRQKEILTLLKQNNLFLHEEVIVHPTESHPPFRLMIRGGKKKKETVTSVINIKLNDGTYTPAFTNLLKDYYLYL